MTKDKERELLNKNYDKLNEKKKEALLLIGEDFLDIQDTVNREKLRNQSKNQIKRRKRQYAETYRPATK